MLLTSSPYFLITATRTEFTIFCSIAAISCCLAMNDMTGLDMMTSLLTFSGEDRGSVDDEACFDFKPTKACKAGLGLHSSEDVAVIHQSYK